MFSLAKISPIAMLTIFKVKATDTKKTIFQIIINFYSKEKLVKMCSITIKIFNS